MTYLVRVDCVPAQGVSPFDVDERERAAGLLRDALRRLTGATGPDGAGTAMSGARAAAHPGGVKLLLRVDAPEPDSAEDAAWRWAEALLAPGGKLDGWSVASCGVEGEADPTAEGPAATQGTGTPRPGNTAEPVAGTGVRPRKPPAEPEPETGAGVAASGRARLRSSAGQLRLGLDRFGHTGAADSNDAGVPEDAAELAASAVVHAVDLVTDGLFGDLADLERRGDDRTAAEHGWELPAPPRASAASCPP